MTPSILVVGATGNTGRSVVETLPKLLKSSKALCDHRVIALTRSAKSPVAQQFTKLPGVEVVEKNWIDIDAKWLRENEVTRAFIASHNEPNHFTHESTFHFEALDAGLEYVVRISTTAANVRPDFPAYYPRTHWAIEQLLSSPAYEKLHWTSLQPNVFFSFYLQNAANLIKQFRETGKQSILRLMASEDDPVGVIDPYDVGVFAAHLLVTDDTTKHNKAKYVLNGPENVTGKQIVELTEEYIRTKVENVSFKDTTFIDEWAARFPEDIKSAILSIKHAPETCWRGECSTATTSKEFLDIAPPKGTAASALKSLLQN